jgi:hypothetical protein
MTFTGRESDGCVPRRAVKPTFLRLVAVRRSCPDLRPRRVRDTFGNAYLRRRYCPFPADPPLRNTRLPFQAMMRVVLYHPR